MIKERTIFEPITYEGQPDGGRTPIIDMMVASCIVYSCW